jgi:dTDP-4-amino-4,6-dideoxygalactose transaminase
VNVPFLDLKQQYLQLKEEIDREVTHVFETSAFILGPQVQRFEKSFAEYLETSHSVGVATGTDALILAFQALDIGPGDEVILPAHTFVATAIGVLACGARPVLVDIDPTTYLMDYDQLASIVTSRTRAICPVHLYGRACDMDRITAFAEAHSLHIVEDTAQAHGARWKGKRVGTFGDFGCFSFYPGKNLGAYGDGGAISTNKLELAAKVRRLRNYGSEVKYEHPERGTNSRLDSVQAAVLDIKLRHLEDWNRKRHAAAAKYCEVLRPLEEKGVVLPDILTANEHVFHLFVIQVDDRARVMEELKQHGVQTGIHYPNPFYLEGGYRQLEYTRGAFPVTERIVSLPVFPEITEEKIEYVGEKLSEIL